MRFLVYMIAVLAAAGIVYFVSGSGRQVAEQAPAPTPTSVAPTAEADAETQLVSLKVPDMHCPFACYPSVKKTLEGQTGVKAVDLAEQQQEGVIDNPVVLVKTTSNFDLQSTLVALEKSGFKASTVEP